MIFTKKSLGQNFLVDKNVVKKIINLFKIKNKHIVEIGPGKGSLTKEILRYEPRSLTIIEKDNRLAQELKLEYSNEKRIKVINDDVLKIDLENILNKNSTIVGNLPYNISSQILVKILKFKNWPPKYDNLIFIFQKELGEKIIGKYSTSDYSRLSIITNYRLNVIKKFNVSSNSFFPKPKITSMVIQFKPAKKKNFKIKRIESLEKITNVLFSNKRKMINKNIKKILSDKKINEIKHLNLKKRPSEIQPEIYYKIAEFFEN